MAKMLNYTFNASFLEQSYDTCILQQEDLQLVQSAIFFQIHPGTGYIQQDGQYSWEVSMNLVFEGLGKSNFLNLMSFGLLMFSRNA